MTLGCKHQLELQEHGGHRQGGGLGRGGRGQEEEEVDRTEDVWRQ